MVMIGYIDIAVVVFFVVAMVATIFVKKEDIIIDEEDMYPYKVEANEYLRKKIEEGDKTITGTPTTLGAELGKYLEKEEEKEYKQPPANDKLYTPEEIAYQERTKAVEESIEEDLELTALDKVTFEENVRGEVKMSDKEIRELREDIKASTEEPMEEPKEIIFTIEDMRKICHNCKEENLEKMVNNANMYYNHYEHTDIMPYNSVIIGTWYKPNSAREKARNRLLATKLA